MPRAASRKQNRTQSTSANDILNSNSTAAHFINYPQPMWLQQNSNPYPPRGQPIQNTYTSRPLQAPVSSGPAPSALPNHLNKDRHDNIGSVHNSIGLPSPVPSHDAPSTRASPENNQIQAGQADLEQTVLRGPDVTRAPEALPLPQQQMPLWNTFPTMQTAMTPAHQEALAHQGPHSRPSSISHNVAGLPSPGLILPTQTHVSQPPQQISGATQPRSRQVTSKVVPGLTQETHASLHAYYDLPQCQNRIEQYFQNKTVQNHGHLPQPLVRLRKFMLSTATEPLDSFYFLLLQLVCVYAIDAGKIPRVFQDIPNVYFALGLSGNILSSLGGFPIEFARYFASFPRDISQIVSLPNELIAAIATFLHHLPARYEATRQTLRQRGFSISPRECWSAFEPITGPCSRLLHLHFVHAIFQFSIPDVVESLDDMFVECQDSVLAHLAQPGHAEAAQLRFETLSRSIMHKAFVEFGNNLVRPTSLPFPTQQPVGRRATMQESVMQQTAGYASTVQYYTSRQSLPTGSSTQQPMIQRPASSMSRFFPPVQTLPAHVQPRPGHPTPHHMRPHPGRHSTSRSNSTTFYPPQPSPQQLQPIPPFAGPIPIYPPLFARPGELPSLPADAHPEVYAMYQSHLTNKVMKLVDYYTEPEHTVPLYQAVNELSLGPNQLRFSTDISTHSFTFEVSEDHFKHRPAEQVISEYQSSEWRVNRATRLFRFRIAKHVPQQDGTTVQKTWMDTPTFWPSDCYFNCNGQKLEPRRSNQWHKNLPIDLMPFLKAGPNILDVFINKLPGQTVESFVGAVECIKLSTADNIIKDVSERVGKAEEFIQSLAAKSKSSAEEDDDELSIVSESVQVSVYDPIMGFGICKTPVRSGRCEHRECFDLETFLQSRLKRPENDVFEADNWACPICKAYSAPSTLSIDEYFVNVRNELIKIGRTDARSIVINKDGTWSVKEEAKDDEQGSQMNGMEQHPEPIEIVDLD